MTTFLFLFVFRAEVCYQRRKNCNRYNSTEIQNSIRPTAKEHEADVWTHPSTTRGHYANIRTKDKHLILKTFSPTKRNHFIIYCFKWFATFAESLFKNKHFQCELKIIRFFWVVMQVYFHNVSSILKFKKLLGT